MLDRKTYNLETGEWKQVSDEFIKLEAEALRQYTALKPEYKDAYKQLILSLCRQWPICMRCTMRKL